MKKAWMEKAVGGRREATGRRGLGKDEGGKTDKEKWRQGAWDEGTVILNVETT